MTNSNISPTPEHRRERLQIFPVLGAENTLSSWYRRANPIRVIWNFIWIYLAKYTPSLTFKRLLLRLTGMSLGKGVTPALAAEFDIYYPEKIKIGDNSIIGYNSIVLTHEYIVGEWREGPVRIGNNVTIGANVTILPGVVIGDGATVSAMSLVNKDIPPGEFWGGVPARKLK